MLKIMDYSNANNKVNKPSSPEDYLKLASYGPIYRILTAETALPV